MNLEPLVVAVALARYSYNVSPGERAEKLYEHFEGQCAEPDDLLRVMLTDKMFMTTELAPPTGAVFVNHALEKYADEAARHVAINRAGSPHLFPPPFGGIDDITKNIDKAAQNVAQLLNNLGFRVKDAKPGEDVALILKKESWQNIFRVLKWSAPMELSVSENAYLEMEGEHWSLGNFWAAIQELQRQFGEGDGDDGSQSDVAGDSGSSSGDD